jgi:hypothetical protein
LNICVRICWPWLCFQPFIFNNWIDYAWKWGPFFYWNCMCTFNYLLFMSWILKWLLFTPQYCWVIKSLNFMNITSICFKMHVCPFHQLFQFLCQVNDLEVIFFTLKCSKSLNVSSFPNIPIRVSFMLVINNNLPKTQNSYYVLVFKLHLSPFHWVFQSLLQISDHEMIIFYL